MRRLPAIALLLPLGLGGCATSEGQPFGTLRAELDAAMRMPSDREVGSGWQKLANDFQIRVTDGQLAMDGIELVDVGGAAAAAFDPANPPPGFSLCHNGHCHSDDGALVDYADIAAALAGNAGNSTTVKRLGVPAIDLLQPGPTPLECDEHCALPESHVGLLRLTAHHLSVAGRVRDGRAEPRFAGERDFAVAIDLEEPLDDEAAPGIQAQPLDLPVDDDAPGRITLRLTQPLSTALFDAVAFDAIAPSTTGVLELATGSPGSHAIAEAFSNVPLTIDIQREDQ
jgi:hypothetical protein